MNQFSSAYYHNIELLEFIAQRLEELRDEVTFVGGCVLGLLITDKAAPDVRQTIDVDCIINIITLHDYHALEKRLLKKGFKPMANKNHPICRWSYDDILLDVMPTDKKILGFSNRWYKDAILNSIIKKISDSINIKIISAPYFLATKLEAFKDRGNSDFLLSHDLEDVISLIDGRPEITNEVDNAADDLKHYLSTDFFQLINSQPFMQALPGHLNYSSEAVNRRKKVEERIKAIVSAGRELNFIIN